VSAPAASLGSHLSDSVHEAEIFTALDVYDHRRVKRRRIGIFPEKEFLPVSLEGHFDEV
jgi:hypothetical protein